MDSISLQAAMLFVLGNVSGSVAPKFALFAPPKQGGSICVRYFMPWQTHPTLAVTSSQCLAACALTIGSVADGLVDQLNGNSSDVLLEHPLGFMNVRLDYQKNGVHSVVRSAQIVRTARKLSSGLIYIPSSIWSA